MNIVTHLAKIADQNLTAEINEQEQILTSVKQNLLSQDEEDLKMLTYFGTSTVVVNASKNRQKSKQIAEQGLISRDDIETVCLQYALRFLPASIYKKEVPLKALNDLKKFGDAVNIMQTKLFMIAPASHFSLSPRPVAKDPVLLYEFEDGYKVISSWGSDFGTFRRIHGFFATNWQYLFASLIGLFMIFSIVMVVVTEKDVWAIGIMSLFLCLIPIHTNSHEDLWDKEHK